MEQNSTPSKEIISVMMELKEKALEQSERSDGNGTGKQTNNAPTNR